MTTTSGFVHGPQTCRACFDSDALPYWHALDKGEFDRRGTKWLLRPNPGYWGDPNPRVLVLGFSKGGDQQEMIDLHVRGRRRFEDVPFNSATSTMRRDLGELLQTMTLVPAGSSIDNLFKSESHGFGFASLVRCSVEIALPGKAPVSSGGGILSRTLEADLPFVELCIDRHLINAPQSVRLVVMLGADERYVRACFRRLGGTSLGAPGEIPYAYTAHDRTFVHVPHPSGQSGGFRAVFNDKRPPNKMEGGMLVCRRQVLDAVRSALGEPAALLQV